MKYTPFSGQNTIANGRVEWSSALQVDKTEWSDHTVRDNCTLKEKKEGKKEKEIDCRVSFPLSSLSVCVFFVPVQRSRFGIIAVFTCVQYKMDKIRPECVAYCGWVGGWVGECGNVGGSEKRKQ